MKDRIVLSSPTEREQERTKDSDFEDKEVKEVKRREDWYDFLTTDSFGMSFLIENTTAPKVKVGDRIRLYGHFGGYTKGVAVWKDGYLVPIIYRTKEEADAEHAEWSADYHRRLKEENTKSLATPLPDDLEAPLRQRIERFREEYAANGSDTYVEGYELAPVLEASRLFKRCNDPAFGQALKDRGILAPLESIREQPSYRLDKTHGRLDWPDTPEWRLIAFDAINSKMNDYQYKLMEELMPEMYTGHSGNTWGAAVSFTLALIRDGDEARL